MWEQQLLHARLIAMSVSDSFLFLVVSLPSSRVALPRGKGVGGRSQHRLVPFAGHFGIGKAISLPVPVLHAQQCTTH
jgi:hypothetical protein